VARTSRNGTIVQTEDASPFRITTIGSNALISKLGLIFAQGDTSDLATVVLVRKCGKGTPATPDVEEIICGLEIELLADDRELVVLKLLESLRLGNRGHDTRRVDHARTQEPGRERFTMGLYSKDDTNHS
jgi:hypothetical protein